MTRFAPISASLFAALLIAIPASFAHAAPPPDHWVGTWGASPVEMPNVRRQPAEPPPASGPSSTPSVPPADAARQAGPSSGPNAEPAEINPRQTFAATDMTLREIVHVSLGGPAFRVVLSNEFGTDPLTIGAAHAALSDGGSSISLTSAAGLTFSGRPSVIIPPGALVVSDPVDVKLPGEADLAISVFLPAQPLRVLTVHGYADQTNYSAPGNVVGAKTLESATPIYSWPFVKDVDVKVPGNDAAIVAFGDSITDGAYATRDANARWPDVLGRRLQGDKKTAGLGVINQGIGGNRILHDGTGPSALARFDRDVIAQAGVKYCIILEGINDIGHAADLVHPYDVVSADDLIAGYTQLVERAHMHGIKVIGATLTPYVGAKYASPAGEQIRLALNKWIRSTSMLDGVIDFEKTTQDPSHPDRYLPAMEHGDHLHPDDAGYKAMGDAINLKLFDQK